MKRECAKIAAGVFKAKCLKLMNQVSVSLFGLQKDSVVIHGSIISPIEESWAVNE